MHEDLGKLIERISKGSGRSPEEVKKLIEEKQDELSGLVSAEGAAYIVGRELGLSLLKEGRRQLKVKNLVSGLRSVDLTVRISQISEPREFTRNGKQGKVLNLLVGDETGTVRLSLWNEELKKANDLKEGDVIRVTGGYVKMDNRGNPELRLGRGRMEKVQEDVQLPKELPQAEELQRFTVAERKNISELKEGDYSEVRACLVQVYRRNPFYEVCPECGARLEQKNGSWFCKEHKEVKPEHQMVISGVIDDGTGNIRAVFFRDMAEKIFGQTAKELRKAAQDEADALAIYNQFSSLGKEFILKGRVKKNEYTESLEFIANDVQEVDVKKECERLLKA